MNFNFGEVLTRAWQIIRNHKVLWIFGILAGCSRGGYRFNSSNSGRGNGGFEQLPPEAMRILQFIQDNLTVILVVGCTLLLLFWAITIFLGTIGRIGLIRGTFQAEEGVERLIFGQLFSESMPYFWRIFGLSLIVALPVLAVVAVLIAALAAFAVSASNGSDASTLGLLGMAPLFIGCFCLLVPIMFVVGMIVRQAENAIVLEDQRVLPALSRGWEVFRANLGPIVLMAIILAVLTLVIGFLAGDGQNWTPLLWMTVGLCLYSPILLFLNGLMTAYVESAWTLTYLRLTKPQVQAPIVPDLPEANA
jgi:hypothetical protein